MNTISCLSKYSKKYEFFQLETYHLTDNGYHTLCGRTIRGKQWVKGDITVNALLRSESSDYDTRICKRCQSIGLKNK